MIGVDKRVEPSINQAMDMTVQAEEEDGEQVGDSDSDDSDDGSVLSEISDENLYF